MSRTITIDPITRLEGHGKITILLDDVGDVDRALLQIPELRGFEAFVVGRPAEEMPQITSRICGVCPMAHHMAATKALDDLYGVTPPPAAVAIRRLAYDLFVYEDHALHFYFLGGPDLVVGAAAPPERRNVLGLIDRIGVEAGRRVLAVRRRVRELMQSICGKTIHPVFGLPGGVSAPIAEGRREEIRATGAEAVSLALDTLDLFRRTVLEDGRWQAAVTGDLYRLDTYSMGLVDGDDRVDFYDGDLRVLDPDGVEHARFPASEYAEQIAERVEPWSYTTFPYLRDPGWKGFIDGSDSGIYRVAPLARLNVAEGMATPRAHAEYERLFDTLGGKPVHLTLANHWARLIEMLFAAEQVQALADDPALTSPEIRDMDLKTPTVGVGVVEAPRGTLIHRYETDDRGVLTACDLVVATVNNAAALSLSVERAARGLIHGGRVDDGLLNQVEMAFRAYDPCMSCATHSLPGQMPLEVTILDARGRTMERLRRP